MKKIIVILTILLLSLGFANAAVNSVTPSTNDLNRNKSWAHVNVVDVGVEEITLEFVNERNFYSCFEYRTDGDTSEKIDDTNYNSEITDGLYPFVCVNNENETITISADEYVEVRMVFGAEGDERFDWIGFDVLFNRTAMITSPDVLENVSDEVLLSANLVDDDMDSVSWAIRKGTCAKGTNTVFGNVDGFIDSYNWVVKEDDGVFTHEFEFNFNARDVDEGDYCFIFNPREDSDESNIRLTREFFVVHTKADVLIRNGVPGEGVDSAPGLNKDKPNDNFAKGTKK